MKSYNLILKSMIDKVKGICILNVKRVKLIVGLLTLIRLFLSVPISKTNQLFVKGRNGIVGNQ